MNEIQLTDHLVAHIGAEGTCGHYRAKICEDGDFREFPVCHEPQTSQAQVREVCEA